MNHLDISTLGVWYKDLDFEYRDDPSTAVEFISVDDYSRYQTNIQMYVARNINTAIQQWFTEQFAQYREATFSVQKMSPGMILPYHNDQYGHYRRAHNVTDINCITRIILFLEDWQPGHISEINGHVNTNWHAGDWVSWQGNTPHLAANIGHTDRYTLQITTIFP
jgi:hypothetical protein